MFSLSGVFCEDGRCDILTFSCAIFLRLRHVSFWMAWVKSKTFSVTCATIACKKETGQRAIPFIRFFFVLVSVVVLFCVAKRKQLR